MLSVRAGLLSTVPAGFLALGACDPTLEKAKQAGAVMLRADEVKILLSGNTLSGQRGNRPFHAYFAADGKAELWVPPLRTGSGRLPHRYVTGDWEMSENGYCSRWKDARIRQARKDCFTVHKQGNQYSIFYVSGRFRGTIDEVTEGRKLEY